MRRRFSFAAPFLLTVVTTLPGCPKSSGETTTVGNTDPEPDTPDGDVEPEGEPYSTWSVSGSPADGCSAYMHSSCPEGASCNPPPPATVQCPEGYAGESEDLSLDSYEIKQYEEDGPCWYGGKKTPCPTWD